MLLSHLASALGRPRHCGPAARGFASVGLVALALAPGCGGESDGPPAAALCVPVSCSALERACGEWEDGCGTLLQCGECTGWSVCDLGLGVCSCANDTCGAACCSPEERCDGSRCVPRGWFGVDLASVRAPDEYTVVVTLIGAPSSDAAERVDAYTISSAAGPLAVLGAAYDPGVPAVTLETERQKLGVTYALAIDANPALPAPLEQSFLAADTARFWASDFADPDFAQYEVVADRVAVGDRSVVYVQQGQSVPNAADGVAELDDHIHPTLTERYHAAPDVDGNLRTVLLWLDGQDYFGGYFYGVNQYPETQTWPDWHLHSNEMELIYLNARYPDGADRTSAHEFSHLLYHERHGFTDPYWDYHDEGLAECAVYIVTGANDYGPSLYLSDPDGLIGGGLSLVHWNWSQWENYALGYLFWMYTASRAGGIDALGELFDLPTGAPSEVDAWLAGRLGSDFATVQRENLLANWIQAANGPFGYEGLLSFAPESAPTVPAGTVSLDLEPYAGTFFRLTETSVDYPGTQGPNITYAAIDDTHGVDTEPPLDLTGGVLLVHNRSGDVDGWLAEHSGPDLPAVVPPAAHTMGAAKPTVMTPAWLDPPPFHPSRREALWQWQRATFNRIGRPRAPLR